MAEKTNYNVRLKDANGGVIWPQTSVTNIVDPNSGQNITIVTETKLTEDLAGKLDVAVYTEKITQLEETNESLQNKIEEYYINTQTAINEKIKSAVKYIGSVQDYSQLPTDLTAQDHGSIYNVVSKDGAVINSQFIWTQLQSDSQGTWQQLGGIADLSNYYTTVQVDDAIKSEQDRAIQKENDLSGAIAGQTQRASGVQGQLLQAINKEKADREASDSLVRGSITALQGAVVGFSTENNIATAISGAITTAASDAQAKAQAAKEAANDYTDQQIQKVNASLESLAGVVYFEQIN